MHKALGVLATVLLIEGVGCDVSAAETDDRRTAPIVWLTPGHIVSLPVWTRAPCRPDHSRDCRRFCFTQYAKSAALGRCLRGCTPYCRDCAREQRLACRGDERAGSHYRAGIGL